MAEATTAGPTDFRLRPARPADGPVLSRIARAAKAHWGYPDELMRLWEPELTVGPGLLRENGAFCVLVDSTIVGFYALTVDGADCELEHMWVDPDFMGRGVGRVLFEHAVEKARQGGFARLRIASDPHAEAFYSKLGAARIGEVPSRPRGRTLPLLEVRLS